jgi:hypothetical protein
MTVSLVQPKKSYDIKGKENKIFLNIGLSVEGGGAPLEKIIVPELVKQELPSYISKFVNKDLLYMQKGCVFMTKHGMAEYQRLKYTAKL